MCSVGNHPRYAQQEWRTLAGQEGWSGVAGGDALTEARLSNVLSVMEDPPNSEVYFAFSQNDDGDMVEWRVMRNGEFPDDAKRAVYSTAPSFPIRVACVSGPSFFFFFSFLLDWNACGEGFVCFFRSILFYW